MDPVQQPRLTTRSDMPRLGDRIGDVLEDDFQHRPAWEVAVWIGGLVFLAILNSLIWGSESSTGQRVVESILALVLVTVVSTGILVKIRFRR